MARDVYVAHPQSDHQSSLFANGMAQLLRYDESGPQRVLTYMPVFSGANITVARNRSVRDMLDNTAAEWLWWIDSDMVFDGHDGRAGIDILDELLKVADPVARPIVGALCFSWTIKECLPTLYQVTPNADIIRWVDYPPNSVVPALTGTGCLLVHRSVFERIREQGHPAPFEWFAEAAHRGEHVGEDINFCLRAIDAGAHPVVITGLIVGHHKSLIVDHRVFREAAVKKVRAGDGEWNPRRPLAVVVPFKDKPELTVQLLAQIDDVDMVVLLDNGSTVATVEAVEAAPGPERTVIPMPGAGIHEMWNRGINEVLSVYPDGGVDVAILNNDLMLAPGALRECQRVLLVKPGMAVSCPNYDGRMDPANPFEDVQFVSDICANRYDGTGGLAGFAMVVRGEFFERGGYRFPEEMRWWWGDNDMLLSVMQAKSWAGIALHAHCRHLDGGAKTAEDWERYAVETAADQAAFERKWGALVAAPDAA